MLPPGFYCFQRNIPWQPFLPPSLVHRWELDWTWWGSCLLTNMILMALVSGVSSGLSKEQNRHFDHTKYILSSMPTSLNLLISFSSVCHSNSVISVLLRTNLLLSPGILDRVWNPLSQEGAHRCPTLIIQLCTSTFLIKHPQNPLLWVLCWFLLIHAG